MHEALGGAYLERSENLLFYSSALTCQASSAAQEGGGDGSGVPFNTYKLYMEVILTQKTEVWL